MILKNVVKRIFEKFTKNLHKADRGLYNVSGEKYIIYSQEVYSRKAQGKQKDYDNLVI